MTWGGLSSCGAISCGPCSWHKLAKTLSLGVKKTASLYCRQRRWMAHHMIQHGRPMLKTALKCGRSRGGPTNFRRGTEYPAWTVLRNLGQKIYRRESSKRNYYIISPRVIIKANIIIWYVWRTRGNGQRMFLKEHWRIIIYHFTHTFSNAHTEAHTHEHTCTISMQLAWRQPGTGVWLSQAEERLC